MVQYLLQIGEWAVFIDLKDAYPCVPVQDPFWKLLCSLSDSKVYCVLLFGLVLSPYIFTRVNPSWKPLGND